MDINRWICRQTDRNGAGHRQTQIDGYAGNHRQKQMQTFMQIQMETRAGANRKQAFKRRYKTDTEANIEIKTSN